MRDPVHVARQKTDQYRAAVDNGHLVAWTAQYKVERIDAGGFFSASHTDEGLVCRYVSESLLSGVIPMNDDDMAQS